MGLDITAYEKATLTDPHEWTDDCYEDGHVPAYHLEGHERSFRGLIEHRCYETSGKTVEFRAGSYSGYGDFRRQLCQAALGVPSDTVWGDPDRYQDQPFYELIYFADNVGCIGPEAAADLAADFDAGYPGVRDKLEAWWRELYELWSQAFHLAAGHGLVGFH